MRFDSDLPIYFWTVALDTAVYLINRSPSSALDGGIPEEVWTRKPVKLSFLKVFGCIAYSLIEKEKRSKLNSKSTKCVFIGYGGDEYGYKLWDFQNNKIIRSRNVVFDEEHTYKDRNDAGEEKKHEFIELDPVRDGEIPRVQTEDGNFEDVEEEDVVEADSHMHTPVPQPVSPQLRRSTRVTRPS